LATAQTSRSHSDIERFVARAASARADPLVVTPVVPAAATDAPISAGSALSTNSFRATP
jgi:hypothetical protein